MAREISKTEKHDGNYEKTETGEKEEEVEEDWCPFVWLPDSTLLDIFSFVEPLSLLRSVLGVCRRWRRLVRNPMLWREIRIRGCPHGEKRCGIVGDCTHVRSLGLSDVASRRVTPEAILGMVPARTQLIHCVDLTDCFRGVTDYSLELLVSRCPRLRTLVLDGCNAVTDNGLRAVARHCTSLEVVSLFATGFSVWGIERLLRRNPRLRRLLAYSTAVTMSTIGILSVRCRDLQWLIVEESEWLSGREFRRNRLTDGMLRVLTRGCKRLTRLKLLYPRNSTTDAGLRYVADGCPRLVSLVLDYCDTSSAVTDSGIGLIIGSCRFLRRLRLANVKVTDATLCNIADCSPFMEQLTVEFGLVTDRGVCAVTKKCRRLSWLLISTDGHTENEEDEDEEEEEQNERESRITDEAVRAISAFARRDVFCALGLECSKITNAGLGSICRNFKLIFLSLSGCKSITYEGKDGLKSCLDSGYLTSLWKLDVSFTELVNGEGRLVEIGDRLPHLEVLNLSDCFIDCDRAKRDVALKAFKTRHPKCEVVLM